jgi:CHAT domain-containing protein/tetratricopeptide (TPR) repeat protein
MVRHLSSNFKIFLTSYLPEQCWRRMAISILFICLLLCVMQLADARNMEQSSHTSAPQRAEQEKQKERVRSLAIRKEPVVFNLKAEEKHLFAIKLNAGQILRLIVDQRGIDVLLVLYGPDAKKLVEVDSPNGTTGPEPLDWIAETTGSYELEIRALEKEAKAGSYAVKDVERREATARDRTFMAAHLLSLEGEKLRSEKTEKSRREAILKFEAALPLWHQIGETAHEARTLYRLGTLHYLLRDPKTAQPLLSQAVALFKTTGGDELEASALLNLGYIESEVRRHDKALDFYQQSLSACRATHCDFEAEILESTGNSYEAFVAQESALDAYQRAALLYRQANDRESESRMLRSIGALHGKAGNRPAAIEAYTQLASLRRSLNDHQGELSALIKSGKAYITDEPQKSLEFYQQALSLTKGDADKFDLAVILNDMGFAHQSLGNQQKALELFNQALPLVTGETRANLLSNIALSYRLMGNRQTALDNYQQALALLPEKDRTNSDAAAAQIRKDTGETSLREDIETQIKSIEEDFKTQKELEAAQRELLGRRAAHDRPAEATTLERIAMMQLTLKEPQQALETFGQLATLFHLSGNRDREADALNKLGLLQLLLQDGPKGLEYLSRSLKIRREVGDRREEKDITGTIAFIGGSLDKRSLSVKTDDLQGLALSAYKTIGDSKAETAIVSELVLELWIAKQHLRALKEQNLLLHTALEKNMPANAPAISHRIKTISEIAGIFLEDEQWQKALERYNQLLPMQRQLKDVAGEADTLHILGYIYFNLGDLRHAVEFFTQALALRRQLQDPARLAQTLNNLGEIQSWQGNRLKALELYEQALPLQREVKDQSAQARTLFRIGEANFLLGEKQKALESFNQSLALTRTEKDRLGDPATLEYIGLVYISLGQPQQAQEYYRYALTHAQRSLAVVRTGQTTEVSKSFLEDITKAGSSYRRETAQAYVISEKKREGLALAELGDAYYRLGMKQDALENFNEALPILKAVGYAKDEAKVLNKVGLLYSSMGDYQRALGALTQALALRRADGNRGRQAEAMHNIGTVYESLGDKQKALEYYSQALTIRREVKDPEGEGETLDHLMRLSQALDKRKLAIFYGKQAVNAFQQLRSHIQGLNRDLQKSFLTSKADTYRQLADLLITDGRLPEAQQVLDLLKQEEYLDFVRGDTGGGPDAAASLNHEEAALLQRYNEIESQIIAISRQRAELSARESRTPEEEQLLKKLERDVEAANVAFEKFLVQLPAEFTNAEKGEVKAALKAAELRSTQELSATLRELGPGTVVLYTVVSPDKYHVILFTSETQVAREYSIPAAELNRKVHQFRVVLRNPQYDPLPLAQELYKIIIGPVAKDLEAAHAETLMWELDGTLRYLPIAALHDGQRYMVERYRNSVFTPASQSRLERPPGEKWHGLGLGVSKGAVPLPFVVDELRGIIHDATAPGGSSGSGVIDGRIMLDDSFTKDSMKSALGQGSGYSLVHIASHFIFKPGNETDSYLLLGGQAADSDEARHLTLAEIKRAPNLFRGVELLTLSACNTAVGEGAIGAGAEVENFGVLAQLKGARAVIATLWRVNDISTMSLMTTFYRLHNETPSTPKIEALREAQLALLHGDIKNSGIEQSKRDNSTAEVLDDWEAKLPRFKSDPAKPYAHPYYWAPFILIGNWR